MVNKAKAKGTAAETRVVNFLLAAGLQAQRVVMKGAHDQGDIHLIGPPAAPPGVLSCILEVKGGQQTLNTSRKLRQDWLDETRTEATNVGSVRGFLIIARHGASVPDYHVWDESGHKFWYLDEFVEFVKGGF